MALPAWNQKYSNNSSFVSNKHIDGENTLFLPLPSKDENNKNTKAEVDGNLVGGPIWLFFSS